MKPDDEADLELLNLANEKRKFALSIPLTWGEEKQSAFERGIDHQWFTLVDVTPIAAPESRLRLMRVFRLTDAGMARLAELSQGKRQ